MNNPYQLQGITANGKKYLLGTYDTHGQAVAESRQRTTDKNSPFTEYRITKVYQYQVKCYSKGELAKTAIYRTKIEANTAERTFKPFYDEVNTEFIGAINE